MPYLLLILGFLAPFAFPGPVTVHPRPASPATEASLFSACPDYNGDLTVGVDDVNLIAGMWHLPNNDPRFDRDADGEITVVDVIAVAVRWQQHCPAGSTCPLFPADNIWNTRIDGLPPDPNSAAYINSIGPVGGLHPDFGAGLWQGGPIGIPFVTVPADQAPVPIVFTEYEDESDPGPYPVPPDAPIEGGPAANDDRHVLVVNNGDCRLYELYHAWPQTGGSWDAGSGAIFSLLGNRLRPDTWTSADAAGFPILAGLVRYDEVAAGRITHALRFTVSRTRNVHVWPARHDASSDTSPAYPPMGQRFRLKAAFDVSGFSAANQVVLTALKEYGMVVADNGSNWFLSGAPDARWDDDDLHQLQTRVQGSNFEAVDVSGLMVDPDSAQAAFPPP